MTDSTPDSTPNPNPNKPDHPTQPDTQPDLTPTKLDPDLDAEIGDDLIELAEAQQSRTPISHPEKSSTVGRTNPLGLGSTQPQPARTKPIPINDPMPVGTRPTPPNLARVKSPSPDLAKAKQRLVSLDTYRGLIMVVLSLEAVHGWSNAMADNFPDSSFWSFMQYHFLNHLPWEAAYVTIWDMIQPSFMFMVGVAMAYSYTKRAAQGHSWPRMLCHALWRSLILIVLGMLLRSPRNGEWNWDLMDVITQIGLGYTFLFLLWNRNWKLQLAVGVITLIAYYSWFALTPTYSPDYDLEALNAGQTWAAETGGQVYPPDSFEAHWQKNANAAYYVDVAVLNELPRTRPHVSYGGGYTTLNFIPAFVTMLIGLMVGQLFRSNATNSRKLGITTLAGLIILGLGLAIHAAGIGPIVKIIWTPSWTLFSGGICLLFLALLFLICDVAKLKFWTWPLVIVGMNPITIYIVINMFGGYIERMVQAVAHTIELGTGFNPLHAFGENYVPIVLTLTVTYFIWLIALWMYRRKIFIRI